jgi:NAD(P)-dependent dehydrogenase (short-subunit alcohol dehydrogenase family)
LFGKKVAIVTGSRRGIGLGIVKALGSKEFFTVVSDIVDAAEVQPTLDELKSLNLEFVYIKCDILKAQDRKSLFEKILDGYGRLDVLVNNAGVAPLERLDILKTTEESFDRVLGINLKSTFFMCQAAANIMISLKEKKEIPDYGPRIVNISSISSYTSSITRGEYCISKAGISMTTRLFADRLAEFNIPVFEVRPGIIVTDMTMAVKEIYEKQIAEGLTPIRRIGYPEDVADCVIAACSGLLDFGTGQVLNADGGFHIRRL